MEPESLSKFNNKADLEFADNHNRPRMGWPGANQMLDLDQFIKVLCDGVFFSSTGMAIPITPNNTYIYNDVNAVAAPSVKQRQVQK